MAFAGDRKPLTVDIITVKYGTIPAHPSRDPPDLSRMRPLSWRRPVPKTATVPGHVPVLDFTLELYSENN